jgi:uncharacterized protein
MKTKKEIFGIILLPLIAIFMFGIFQFISFIVGKETMFEGKELAWYLGFILYWPLCCILIPIKLIGKKKIIDLYRKSKVKVIILIFALIPVLLTLIGTTFMEYDKVSVLGKLILLLMVFGNGIFEEVLWRGVYIELFPNNIFFGVIWPTIWFAIWHLAPGFVSGTFNPILLMSGAFFFGLCWSIVSWKSNSIRFSTFSHILTGLVRIFI